MLSGAEVELFAAALKVDGCHAHHGCSRCHPGLRDAIDHFLSAHPDVNFNDVLDDYWFADGQPEEVCDGDC